MTSPWTDGDEMDVVRLRELHDIATTISRMLASLADDGEVVAVTGLVLWSMPDRLSKAVMECIIEAKIEKQLKKRKKS